MQILRSFNWNDQDYTVVEGDDGQRIELRCNAKEAPAIYLKLSKIVDVPQPARLEITEYQDKVLLAEVKRRDIKQVILGEAI